MRLESWRSQPVAGAGGRLTGRTGRQLALSARWVLV